jgi:hypothetical protein
VRRSVLGSDREEEDCQPCAAAPLLRDEAARRSWVESELAACCVVSAGRGNAFMLYARAKISPGSKLI